MPSWRHIRFPLSAPPSLRTHQQRWVPWWDCSWCCSSQPQQGVQSEFFSSLPKSVRSHVMTPCQRRLEIIVPCFMCTASAHNSISFSVIHAISWTDRSYSSSLDAGTYFESPRLSSRCLVGPWMVANGSAVKSCGLRDKPSPTALARGDIKGLRRQIEKREESSEENFVEFIKKSNLD